MIELDLSSWERETLVEMLEGVLSDLRMEIADTDRQDFREGLKARKAALQKLLAALAPGDGSA